jgi:acylphosphatase
MKLKVKIAGPKVHDIGYRVFLLKHAMNLALSGLSTYNWEEDGQQEVIALVVGDEARITAFLQTVEKNKQELADEIKGMREDIQPGYAMQFRQMQVDVRAIKDRLGMS